MQSTLQTTPSLGLGRWLVPLAWLALIYNLLVILWGAVVRITGAGAGCGEHWPLCNGVMLPQNPTLHTIIEFSHRLTSSLSGVLAIGLVALAFSTTRKGHPVRLGALLSLGLIILEGLVGGVQVLLGLTAQSSDPARGFVQGVHLANTFALLGALLLTVLWASGRLAVPLRGQGRVLTFGIVALLALLLLSMMGAVTALGDLLFKPAIGNTPIDTVKQDFAVTASIIENLRVIHPLLAVLTSAGLAYLVAFLRRERPNLEVKRWGNTLWALLAIQLLAGFLNIWLKAPDWMQLVHLLLACLVWLNTVLLLYGALTVPPQALPAEGRGLKGIL